MKFNDFLHTFLADQESAADGPEGKGIESEENTIECKVIRFHFSATKRGCITEWAWIGWIKIFSFKISLFEIENEDWSSAFRFELFSISAFDWTSKLSFNYCATSRLRHREGREWSSIFILSRWRSSLFRWQKLMTIFQRWNVGGCASSKHIIRR